MENLRKITKIKLGVMLSSMTLPIAIVIVMAVGRFEFSKESIFFYWSPLPYIICALVEAYLTYKNYRYVKILRDDEYADYYLIKKNDERNKMIRLHTNALVHKIFIYVLAVVLVFTAFLDKSYFIMAGGIALAFLVIHVAVSIYYNKKF
ncbi:hypothetical protein EI71_01665 [Anaeroplasma bactoclasticum]|jgi:hypothetical protein|uniref:Uncharacterized protein n=1 Tax=Anaeroplasma bactoclasticum TaxID=2088 RepID=A0A397QVE8_9MOLU|nr:hypothetical protein [Anaeroplasma bactoclasticum]RIA65022.1 hypothetical protein EI71_01665 [Anaeroplasma bactoclasticum]